MPYSIVNTQVFLSKIEKYPFAERPFFSQSHKRALIPNF